MSGYVRIHRTLIDHPAFRNDAESMAFAWMIAKAAWASKRVRYKERCITLERGQLAVSQRDMARALDRDKAWIERLWKRLKNEAMIRVDSEAGVAVITICNYAQYQSPSDASEAVNEAHRKAGARQGQGTEQEREKGKKKNTLPDWIPVDEWGAFRKMRRAMKVPFTEEAEAGIIADLDRLRGEGHCPKLVLLKAVKRGWRGVFGDDDTRARAGKVTAEQQRHNLETMIPLYERMGKTNEAAEARRKLAAIGSVANDVLNRASIGQ